MHCGEKLILQKLFLFYIIESIISVIRRIEHFFYFILKREYIDVYIFHKS